MNFFRIKPLASAHTKEAEAAKALDAARKQRAEAEVLQNELHNRVVALEILRARCEKAKGTPLQFCADEDHADFTARELNILRGVYRLRGMYVEREEQTLRHFAMGIPIETTDALGGDLARTKAMLETVEASEEFQAVSARATTVAADSAKALEIQTGKATAALKAWAAKSGVPDEEITTAIG